MRIRSSPPRARMLLLLAALFAWVKWMPMLGPRLIVGPDSRGCHSAACGSMDPADARCQMAFDNVRGSGKGGDTETALVSKLMLRGTGAASRRW